MSVKRKHSELRNFIPNHSGEDKNAPNSVPIRRREKKQIFVPKPLGERKNFWELVSYHSRTKKNTRTTFQKTFFRGIPFWIYFETQKIPLLELFFQGITETILSLFRTIFSKWNFDGNSTNTPTKNKIWAKTAVKIILHILCTFGAVIACVLHFVQI